MSVPNEKSVEIEGVCPPGYESNAKYRLHIDTTTGNLDSRMDIDPTLTACIGPAEQKFKYSESAKGYTIDKTKNVICPYGKVMMTSNNNAFCVLEINKM